MQQESIGFLLMDISRLMRRAFQQRFESNGGSPLTLAQARALVYVSRHEGVRQVELAELLDIQPITLARLIDQLVALGLVQRRPDPEDRRAHRIVLTAAAASHLATIDEVAAAVRGDALRGLNKQQVTATFSSLRTMRNNLATRQAD